MFQNVCRCVRLQYGLRGTQLRVSSVRYILPASEVMGHLRQLIWLNESKGLSSVGQSHLYSFPASLEPSNDSTHIDSLL